MKKIVRILIVILAIWVVTMTGFTSAYAGDVDIVVNENEIIQSEDVQHNDDDNKSLVISEDIEEFNNSTSDLIDNAEEVETDFTENEITEFESTECAYNEPATDDYSITAEAEESEMPMDESDTHCYSEISVEDIEDKEQEIVGSNNGMELHIFWQDGYEQIIMLESNIMTAQDAKTRSIQILKTMGLKEENYSVTQKGTVTTAKIRSRSYYSGDDEVRVLAHMGYYKTATRNTLSSYRVARALGFHYVGGDVRFTKDNVPVIIHDPTINATARRADGSRITEQVIIREHTYKELLKYDFGLSTNEVWKGEKIPTLKEYVVLCKKIGLKPNIHIKMDTGLTNANFEAVADIVLEAGMQGSVTYAANVAWYLKPIIKKDPVSLIDIVITDNWDPHYVTDALALKTGQNKVELAIQRRLYHHNIATTCRYNGILLTCSANSEEEAAYLDAFVDEISTDGTLPDVIIRGARKRVLHGDPYITKEPTQGVDYRIRAHANYGLVIRTLASIKHDPIRFNTNEKADEISRWRFYELDNGYYNIISSRNSYAIGVKDGSTAQSASVYITDWNTSYKAQMWKIIHQEDGSVSFINKNSGKALQTANSTERNNAYFNQGTYDGRSAQRFWLTESTKQTNIKYVKDIIRILPRGKNKVISTTGNTANVATASCLEDNHQKYRVLYSGDGYYRIECIATGMCLTINSTGRVVAAMWSNSDKQRWKPILIDSGGNYRIISKTGTAMTLDGSDNRSLHTAGWSGSHQQRWKLLFQKKYADMTNTSHTYYLPVHWAGGLKLFSQDSAEIFGVNSVCKRGEAINALWKISGSPNPKTGTGISFKDITANHKYYKAILWAYQKGITKGYSDGTFGPDRNVSRGEFMMFLWRLNGKPAPKAVAKSPFLDVATTNTFYKAILWGYQNKITTGYTSGEKNGKYCINENCTRGQIATFLFRTY